VSAGDGPVMIEWPDPWSSLISLPGDGRLSASFSVTVIVVVLTPSEGTGDGDAPIPPLAGGGGTKLIVKV